MEGEDDAYDAEDIEKLLAEAKTMNEARSKNGGSMAGGVRADYPALLYWFSQPTRPRFTSREPDFTWTVIL